ncbi:macrolide family glycosyltransferase [Labedaea rhizosphaerae]|uniref:MGT family glycosyltransferase n=1 Tax=Labedaea rhizosphaerae TaxID=598644 RepID=A0A4R6S1M7_LABRH|nr:macrolide family glycosyltransferase [Labedaea rhizosphaerae]TDP92887.1 MGT family glycosyltransferase [Labedaea rhizosphaerae]
MSHIAVLGNAGLGHAIPVLETVGELIARGHRVTYAAAGAAVAKVAETGATVVEYPSVLAGVDLTVLDTVEEMDRLMVLGLQDDRSLIAEVEAKLGDDRPDLVVFDATRFTVGRILARKWAVPSAAFCTVLLSNEHFSFYDRVQQKQGALPKRRPYVAKALKGLVELLATHGQSNRTLEEFYRPQEGLFVAFYARSFQYAGDTFDDKYVFVGPNLAHETEPGDWTPPADGRRVLMISLGTSVHRRPEFFRMCLDAFRDSDWHLVIHAHDGLDVGELPANAEVHRWLPQLAVLAHTDVLLCHGGMGTLMAAFAKDTPVVVVPNSAEQMINADRVVELGLGRTFGRDEVTAESLRSAVETVHADPATRARVAAMRADILRSGGGMCAADAIEAYLKRSADQRPEVAEQGT